MKGPFCVSETGEALTMCFKGLGSPEMDVTKVTFPSRGPQVDPVYLSGLPQSV